MEDKNPRKISNDKRIAAENELAQALGYPTWRRLTTAAIKGEVILGIIKQDDVEKLKKKKDDANA